MEKINWKQLLPWIIIVLLVVWIGSWLVIENKDEEIREKEQKIRQEERNRLLDLMTEKDAFEDSLSSMENQRELLKEELLGLQGELAAARDGLEQAKEWQLLRTQEERESDISAATQRIQEAERAIRNAEINISWHQSQVEALKQAIERLEQQIQQAQ